MPAVPHTRVPPLVAALMDARRYPHAAETMVRAKVALIHARQNVTGAVRRDEVKTFSHHLRLAESPASPGHPALVLMHGLSASGKTKVAQTLVAALGAIRVRSDIERKRLYGLAAVARSNSTIGGSRYDDKASQRTYECLAGVAALALRSGWRVIVDATSLRRQQRDAFRQIARAMAVPFVIVSCTAADDVMRGRLARRRAAGVDASEATIDVLEYQFALQQPLGPDELAGTVMVGDAGADAGGVAERVTSRLAAAVPVPQ